MMNIQQSSNEEVSVTTTSAQAIKSTQMTMSGSYERTQIIITNTSSTAVITLNKSDYPAVANKGVILQPNQAYIEATDGGFTCWQGAIQAIGNASGTLSVVQTFRAREF